MGYNLKPSYSSVNELTTQDRGISIMYGRQPDALGGDLIPIKVDASGSIVIGTGITLTGELDVLSKGIYDPTFVDPNPQAGAAIIGLKQVGDATATSNSLYAALVRDPRMTFTGGALEVVSAGTSGTIFTTQTISVTSPTYTTFASTGISAYTVQGLTDKSFVVKNTGANQVQVRAFVSMDGGISYDVPILNATTLLAGASLWLDDSRAFTGLQFQLQRDPSGDTTVVLKGYAQ